VDSGGPKEPLLDGGPDCLCEGAVFRREKGWPFAEYRDSAASCANTTYPFPQIDIIGDVVIVWRV